MSGYADSPWKDRMKAFLLNEDMADVYFLVGIDDVKERLPAHKSGQLNGHYEVPETIVVDDATPEAFKIVLGYIYTDGVGLSPDNAFPALYLAKKYMLNNLVAHVTNYIVAVFGGQSIAKVLPHLHLVEGEHAESVWDAIDLDAEVVLKSSQFLELSHDNVCDILRRDLNVDELTVYLGALAWTQAECARCPFDTDGREVLGDALKLIRFPLMSIEEFAGGPAKSSLLSDQEKLQVNNWYALRASHDLTTFSSTPRKRPLLSCTRFVAANIVKDEGGRWINTREFTRFISFSVNARVLVHGVAFFGRKDESNAYEVDISLINASSGKILATTQAEVITDASEDAYKVLFDRPVLIVPGTQYKVTAIIDGPRSMYARYGGRVVICDSGGRTAMFTFTHTGLR